MTQGLVWGALGQGLTNAGNSLTSFLSRDIDREDRQQERREELAQRAKERRQEFEDRAADQAARDSLYRRTADQQQAGSKKSGAADSPISLSDLAQTGPAESLLARRAGMTVPELRALRNYSETGDVEPFKKDIVKQFDVRNPDNPDYESSVEQRVVKADLPPGFEKEARSKMQALAKIEESFVLGGKFDDVTKGRRTQQEVDASSAAIANPANAGVIGQGMAAGKGSAIFGGDTNTTRNNFTGASSATDVGRADIAKLMADANKAAADATNKPMADMASVVHSLLDAAGKMRKEADTNADTTRKKDAKGVEQPSDADRLMTNAMKFEQKAQDLLDQLMAKRLPAGARPASVPTAAPAPGAAASSAAARGAAPVAAPAASASAYPMGLTKTVQSGPNRGKTVKWDGQGWVLQ